MTGFASRLLNWWSSHGRHDLPWQLERTPYRVWMAEIMLQQTQVSTVIPYFERFMTAFPDLDSLARADLDDVLAHWSGLGYYARARNLHAAARQCRRDHDGQLPQDAEALQDLPGIGRSTANAIVAQAYNRRAPILDGNVKRVLARHAGIDGWPGRAAVLRRLWQAADDYTPADRAADYTQAIMDLGATVCTRRPDCGDCPVSADCTARAENRQSQLPTPRPKRTRPRRSTTMLIVNNERGEILLKKRPPSGIWGGMWSLPESNDLDGMELGREQPAPEPMRHQFTHFTLDIDLQRHTLSNTAGVRDDPSLKWMTRRHALAAGLPQPVRRIIESLD